MENTFIIILFLLIFGIGCRNSQNYNGISSWSELDDLPFDMYIFTADVVGDTLYTFGGAKLLDKTWAYNFTSETWSNKKGLPNYSVYNSQSIAVDNNIYILGGYHRNHIDNSGYLYDSETDKWSTIASMNSNRTSFGIAAVNGYIYVIGGSNDTQFNIETCERYDIANDEWSYIADYPLPILGLTCQSYDNLIYCNGGSNGTTIDGTGVETMSNHTYVYDPDTDSWKGCTPSPYYSIDALKSTLIEDVMIVVNVNGYYVESYHILEDRWQIETNFPVYSDGCSAVSYQSKVYVLGLIDQPQTFWVSNSVFSSSTTSTTNNSNGY